MKTKVVILCLLSMMMLTASAADLTRAQKAAQLKLYQYLEKEKFDPAVDESDNSVAFHKGGVLYWITFEEESPILYTFHRKAFKIGEDNKSYHRIPAIVAANEVSKKHKALKLTVGDKRVEITIPAYAASPEDYNSVFKSYFAMFDNVAEDFKKEYEAAKNEEYEKNQKMEEEMRKQLPPSVLENQVVNVSFRLIDDKGRETTGYDKPLRRFNAQFIQPRIEFLPWKNKNEEFTLQIKIYTPEGKLIALNGKKYSGETVVELVKSKNNQRVEFDEMGSADKGFWKAGEYKVEVLESGSVIYTTSFSLL